MLNILGAFLVIFGCTGVGISIKNKFMERIKHLKRMKQVFLLMYSGIHYERATLPECCKIISEKMEEPYAHAFYNISETMNRKEGVGFSIIWRRELESFIKGIPVWDEEKKLFINFGYENGYADQEMQEKIILQNIGELDKIIKEAENGVKEKSKVAIYLGFMGGIFLTLVFI